MSLAVEIERRGDHLRIGPRAALPDLESARAAQRAIEAQRDATGCRRILLHASLVDGCSDDVRDAMLEWVQSAAFDRAAVLSESSMTAVRVRMEALVRRVRVRAFRSEAEALTWLTRP